MTSERDFANILYELRRKAGKEDFTIEEAVTVIRQISATVKITFKVLQTQTRGGTYFVEDDALRRNYIINPSFEFDLTSWTESITATGTTARDSAQSNNGDESLKLDMTDSTASGEVVSRNIVITGLVSGEVWSCSVRIRPSAYSDARFTLRMEFLDSGDAVQATHNVDQTSAGTAFVDVDNENRTAPATTTKLKVSLILQSTAANATGTVHCDGVLAEKASSVGTYFDGDTANCFWEGTIHASENINDVDGSAAICGFFKASA